MAREKRNDAALKAIAARLVGSRAGFFTTVRTLEQLDRDAVRVGGDAPLADERVYFRHWHSFSSAPHELSDVVWTHVAEHQRFEVTTCFLGLTGADSPMPLYIAEELLEDTDDAQAQREFLDGFHNRLTALYYRAICKYHYEWEYTSTASDLASRRLLALAAVDLEICPPGLTTPQLLRLSSLLAWGPSTPNALSGAAREILASVIDEAPLEIEQFCGGWVPYDPEQTNRLGRRNNRVADTFMLGTRVRHPAHRARIVIGPMPPAVATKLSPGSPGFVTLQALLRVMCAAPVAFDLELRIEEGRRPPFLLGRRQLGQDVCLIARRATPRIDSQVYRLN